MPDIKLDPGEEALYNEVGSRGDYFRAAIGDRAAQEVNETGRISEITTEGGRMLDAVLAPEPSTTGDTVDSVVAPTDLSSVVGEAPGSDPAPVKGWPDKDVSGA